MADIIPFPKGKLNTPPQSVSDILSSVEEDQAEHLEYVLEDILNGIASRLYENGFDITKQEALVPLSFTADAIKATMLASQNKEHVLHDVAVQYFNDKSD